MTKPDAVPDANPYQASDTDRTSENSPDTGPSKGPLIIAGLVLLLLVLHQDNWFWTDDTKLLGFMPIGLFWHACISIGAALTWFLATRIAWPIHETESFDRVDSGEGK